MNWRAICVVLFGLAGCSAPVETEVVPASVDSPTSSPRWPRLSANRVGRFQVIDTAEFGPIRLDTQTGQAQVIVAIDKGPGGANTAYSGDGKQLVWLDVVGFDERQERDERGAAVPPPAAATSPGPRGP